VSDDPAWQPREGLAFPWLLELCRWSDQEWRTRLKGSALGHAGLKRIRRSLSCAADALPEPDRTRARDAIASHQE
jgi:epoxyqueuosine reductase QueG